MDSLRGVGAERTAQLARLGLHTIGDLLLHAPRRYEDRRQSLPIAQLTKEQAAVTRGTVVAMGINRFRQGTQSVFELILSDGSARLHCRWWNLPCMENYFTVGQEVFAYGKLRELKPRCMDHPETEVVVAGEESLDRRAEVPVRGVQDARHRSLRRSGRGDGRARCGAGV